MIRDFQYIFLLVFACIVFLSSCASQDWKTAQALNTIESYENYLRYNPDSEFDKEAREALKTAKAKKKQLCEDLSKIKLGMTCEEVYETLKLNLCSRVDIYPNYTFKDKPWTFQFVNGKLYRFTHHVVCNN